MESEKTKIVLCAEDDPDDKELFCETVSKIDQTVHLIHAENGIQLLELLRSLTREGKRPCLIVMDVNMPIMDGREALARIRSNKLWAKIPVCIYSTSPPHIFDDLAANYEAVIVRKPDNMEDIIATVKFLLSHCK